MRTDIHERNVSLQASRCGGRRCWLRAGRGMMRARYISLIAALAMVCVTGCNKVPPQSSANEAPVPDGQVILLKRGNELAAVILHNQRMRPERTDFTWFYRADGRGTFSPSDPAVSTGSVSNASTISFATFSAEWSINMDGKGWVYFSAGPTEFRKTADYVMCVTTETNVMAMDATERKWNYRGRPHVNVRALIDSQLKQ